MSDWSGLHSKNNKNKFELLNSILKEKKSPNCDCQGTSTHLLREILCITSTENESFEKQMATIKLKFDLINDDSFFFFHFHNLINLKLGKELFFLNSFKKS